MQNRLNPLYLHLAAIGLALGQSIYYYPQLPDRIASHFGPNGEANGWMEKGSFFGFYIIMLLVVAVFIGGSGTLVGKLPNDMINLPNKDFWLAPERRASTLNALQIQMSWFSVATLVLLIAMMQLTFQANLTPTPVLDNRAMILVGAYMVYTLIWTVLLIRRFAVQR